MFDFYASCSTIGDRYHLSLDRMLLEARAIFPNRGFADVNLVISHRRRVAINEKVQAIRYRTAQPDDVLRIAAVKQHGLNLPQKMILWPGVRFTAVLGGLSKKGSIKTSCCGSWIGTPLTSNSFALREGKRTM